MLPVPPPVSSDKKPTTDEFAALQVEAQLEDKKRSPASHWDGVKSNVAIIGTLCAVVLGFIAFGDRVVARAESRTAEGMTSTNKALNQHIEDSRVLHGEIRDAVHELVGEQKEFRADMKALYRAIPSRRMQSRLEVDVVEPEELEFRVPVGPVRARDGGR